MNDSTAWHGYASLAKIRTDLGLAVRKLRAGDARQAALRARMARGRLRWTQGPEEDRLDVELSAVSVLAEAVRRDHRDEEADALLDELEALVRRVVELLGENHPKSCAALVALASAEFGAAGSAADRDRMERAVDVLALAAQKTAAVLGASHPHALATLRAFVGAEYEAAVLLGPERRRDDARALVESAAARSEGRQEGAPSAPALAPEDADAVHFSVLGPLRARRGGEMLQIGSPRQRALLAILLLSDGHAASPEELIEGIWDENTPETAQAAMRTYAYRLRKCLGPDTLVRDAGGYALRIRDNEFDLAVAEKLASSAEAAAAAGHAEHARDLYATALQLFVGEPLAGVPGPYAERHRERLSQWRQTLLERRVELDLATGRYDEAVADLTALTPTDPLSDRLRELLVLAQHRSRTEG